MREAVVVMVVMVMVMVMLETNYFERSGGGTVSSGGSSGDNIYWR